MQLLSLTRLKLLVYLTLTQLNQQRQKEVGFSDLVLALQHRELHSEQALPRWKEVSLALTLQTNQQKKHQRFLCQAQDSQNQTRQQHSQPTKNPHSEHPLLRLKTVLTGFLVAALQNLMFQRRKKLVKRRKEAIFLLK